MSRQPRHHSWIHFPDYYAASTTVYDQTKPPPVPTKLSIIKHTRRDPVIEEGKVERPPVGMKEQKEIEHQGREKAITPQLDTEQMAVTPQLERVGNATADMTKQLREEREEVRRSKSLHDSKQHEPPTIAEKQERQIMLPVTKEMEISTVMGNREVKIIRTVKKVKKAKSVGPAPRVEFKPSN